MSRTIQRVCTKCGAHYCQDWLEEDECPNGCDNEEEDEDEPELTCIRRIEEAAIEQVERMLID